MTVLDIEIQAVDTDILRVLLHNAVLLTHCDISYVVWRLDTWPMTEYLSQLCWVDDTFGLLTVDVSLFQEPGLSSAHTTLRSLVLLCGTVYQHTFTMHPFLCVLLLGD